MVEILPPWWNNRPAVTPDGTLACLSRPKAETGAGPVLAIVDVVQDRIVRTVTADDFAAASQAVGWSVPAGAIVVAAVAMSTDGTSAFVASTHYGAPLWSVDLATGTPTLCGVRREMVIDLAAAADGAHAYLLFASLNTDRVIGVADPVDGQIPTTVHGLGIPIQQALTPSRDRICVLVGPYGGEGSGPGTLLVVPTGGLTAPGAVPFAASFAVGVRPRSVAATDTTAYVTNANTDTGTITVIPLRPGGGYRQVPLAFGARPTGIAVTTGGHWLYVSDRTAGTLTLLDGRSMEVVEPARPLGAQPAAMAISADDRVLCVRTAGGTGLTVLRVPPVVLAVQPAAAPAASGAAGATVLVRGTGLDGGPDVEVFVGDTPGTVLRPGPGAPGTSLEVELPASGWVTVRTPAGTSPAAETDTWFELLPTPVLTGVDPPAGPLTGRSVRLTGWNLGGIVAARFGGTEFAAALDADGAAVTVTAPPGSPGPVPVTVRTDAATSNALEFTYLPEPTVTAVVPDTAPTTGGTVELRGTGLTAPGVPAVRFGTTPAARVEVVAGSGGTKLRVAAPAHGPGAADVTVSTPGGSSAPKGFRYVLAPRIDRLDPLVGPPAGGPVTIFGTGLAGATSVTFDGAAADLGAGTDETLAVTAPAHPAGTVPVIVRTPVGPSEPVPFTYAPVPVATEVVPTAGPLTGGEVEIRGHDLAGATAVVLGETTVTPLGTPTDTAIRLVLPPAPAGAVQLVVRGPGGESRPLSFRYLPAPTITRISPTVADVDDTVTLYGTNFADVDAVTFGDAVVTDMQRYGAGTAIDLAAPRGEGTVWVVARSAGGPSNAVEFRYR